MDRHVISLNNSHNHSSNLFIIIGDPLVIRVKVEEVFVAVGELFMTLTGSTPSVNAGRRESTNKNKYLEHTPGHVLNIYNRTAKLTCSVETKQPTMNYLIAILCFCVLFMCVVLPVKEIVYTY